MPETFGNSRAQIEIQAFLTDSRRTLALTGPAHLGKASCAEELFAQSFHPADFLTMGEGIDGVREAVEFSRSAPLESPFRVILVDDADGLGEPAQDALLKLTEEPHPSLKVVLVAHDPGHLQPALRSRIRNEIRWEPLNPTDMHAFCETVSSVISYPLMDLATGRPGLYRSMMESPGFEELFAIVTRILSGGSKPVLFPTPDLVKGLKGPGPVRDAVVHILRAAARSASSERAVHVLRFCGTLSRVTSASADIHWQRMAAHLSDVL